ncbi:MAG: methylmalonyl-CoA mutase family protein, partial [Desulfobacteraceae bacterium]|nr:methylmalonyl-CoA mutase family protein [Desulfobacteraceae bacterium]
MSQELEAYIPQNAIKIVTATSLFDGHDAAINIMRRILQDTGAEVIHIGHNRSAKEVVDAAIEEDAQGIAVSSYQGGHMEYFKYMKDLLDEQGASHVKIFGGGGGVIIPAEMDELHAYGITRIYAPEDGAKMGLQGMINDMMRAMDAPCVDFDALECDRLSVDNKLGIARCISAVQEARAGHPDKLEKIMAQILPLAEAKNAPVIGLTGTGGAGKSSLTDELIIRILRDLEEVHIAVISCDPSRRKTGGALLGDRIRMNSIDTDRVYMRSLATRRSQTELPESLPHAVAVVKSAGFDIILLETAGIGQGDSRVVDLVDMSIYVMTAEYGAPSQLEKIDMLDYADIVVVNKYEKKGAEDAIRDVRKQVQRNRKAWDKDPKEMPVYGTIASKFNDDGITAFYHAMLDLINERKGIQYTSQIPGTGVMESSSKTIIIPGERTRYLAEIADTVREYHADTRSQAEAVRRHWHLTSSMEALDNGFDDMDQVLACLKQAVEETKTLVEPETDALISHYNTCSKDYAKDDLVYQVRDKEFRVPLYTKSLSHSKIPKIARPGFSDPGDQYQWMRKENFAGNFPYTAGVFPLKRADEDPTRMFAGEGGPADTNRRFKLLSSSYPAKRLSTAFDSVTLYGFDPDRRPDIYGKIGTSGVSICTLDDVKLLYHGFDLCAANTSVSMTINGPAPMMLAMFMNTAIDQQMEKFEAKNNRKPTEQEAQEIKAFAVSTVRGT